jgi:uncharacterized protein (TIGR03118 family)
MSSWPHPEFVRWNNTARPRRCLYRPFLEGLEERCLLAGGYTQLNLASDVPGVARFTDPNLVNPWGISFSPTGPFWFAENGKGISDLLDGYGHAVPLRVRLPLPSGPGASPTGTVFNGGPGFRISENGLSAPSRFLFATEDGIIAGWSGVVDLGHALAAVDNSSSGAVYKGLAFATDPAGHSFLYAADFGRGTIDVFDQDFKAIERPGSFQDTDLPEGYAPFNIQNFNDLLFVSYAQRDEGHRDDVAGEGHGFIDIYDTGGNLVRRFASQGALNSPWGLALAPADFGPFGSALLVGNNGDGRINAFNLNTGAFLGPLADDGGNPITVPYLWALMFGNDHLGGASDTLFFTAGFDNEEHGLFGAIQSPQRRRADTAGAGTFDPHAPGEPGDYPLPPSDGPVLGDDDPVEVAAILLPLAKSSLAMIPTLSTVPESGMRRDRPVPVSGIASFPSTSIFPFSSGYYHSLPLNAFLDLTVTLSENPARQPLAKADGDFADPGRFLSTAVDIGAETVLAESAVDNLRLRSGAEQGSKSLQSSGQGKAVAHDPSEHGSESGNRTQENKGRRWRQLLCSLLVVIGIPVIWSFWRSSRMPTLKHGYALVDLPFKHRIS